MAGHDATRSLATFNVEAVKDEWDDYSDLSKSELSSVQEWAEQFSERYELVGKLVKDGDSLEEDDETTDVSEAKSEESKN